MKGRKRTQPGYHASRGWFYKPIQKVITKWDAVFGREFTHDTFQQLRRVIENRHGHMEIEVRDSNHIKFIYELMKALDDLHDPKKTYGWVVRLWPQCNYDAGNASLLTYDQIRQHIIDQGGPTFTTDALKQAAIRLKLTSFGSMLDSDESSVFNPDIPLRKSRKPIRN